MSVKTYWQKLTDPRWQKKRLIILERDEFMCQQCFDTEEELHVHHIRYNNNPWDADDKYLITLCKSCHKHIEEAKKESKEALDDIITEYCTDAYYETVELIKDINSKKLNPYELLALRMAVLNFSDKDYSRLFNKYSKSKKTKKLPLDESFELEKSIF